MTDLAVSSPRLNFRPFARIRGLARRSPTGAIGFAIVGLFALAGILSPWITPFNPTQAFPREILVAPDATYWFGTDGNGMDIFSRVIHGARYAFAIAVPAVLLSMLIGVPVGLWVGYVGGAADEITMRVFDALRVFPSIILALAVVAAAGPSVLNVVLVIGTLDSPIFARVVRAEVLALRSSTMVEAAKATGNPTWRIVLVHLLPNAIQGAMAQSAVRAAWAIRISAALAFLGVGIQVPTPEWGVMIRQGAEFMVTGQWWVALFPGLALMFLMLGLNMLGDGLQELLNPRRRG